MTTGPVIVGVGDAAGAADAAVAQDAAMIADAQREPGVLRRVGAGLDRAPFIAGERRAVRDARIGDPTAALVEASEHLDLLVRGSSARGPVRATVLGTVTEALLRHAACPVMIVPRPDLSSASAPGPSTAACRTR